MDYLKILATLAGILAIGMISPGPNFVIVTSTAMRVSRHAGLMAALGLAGASLTWTALSVAGLGLIISHAAWAYEAIRIVGALYLIWIGVKMIIVARKPLDVSPDAQRISAWAAL